MIVSNLSNVLSVVSLTPPSNLKATFQYNYYVSDESTTENSFFDKPPREVRLSFDRLNLASDEVEGSDEAYKTFVNNLEKIHSVEDISTMKNTQVSIQDTGLLSRSYESIQRSAKIRKIEGNPTDKSLKLSNYLQDLVDPDVLQALAVNYNSLSTDFISNNKALPQEKFQFATGLQVSMNLDDKVVSNIFEFSETSTPSRSPVAAGLLSKALLQRQTDARKESPKLSTKDFTSAFSVVSFEESFSPTSSNAIRVGYIVERIEELSNGKREKKIIAALKNSANSFTDYKIKYGSRYSYLVSSVYLFIISSISLTTNDCGRSGVLISSLPSNIATVTTEETVPPQPPGDIRFHYDHSQGELTIRWEFPVDKTNDITRFQLFRRKKLTDPFTLIKEFDFDKSLIVAKRNDAPLPINIKKSDYPIRRFVDYDFGKNSEYIYALCSVDAHGYVSNYSSQYKVSYNRKINNLEIKSMSQSGAPRPYPNLYVNVSETLTLDSITTSKISSLDFTFDPEYLKVTNEADNDLNFLQYEEDGTKYYVTVIDTTRAQQILIPISIKDLRSRT